MVSLNINANGDVGQTSSATAYDEKNYIELTIPQYTMSINKKIQSFNRVNMAGFKRSFWSQIAFNSTAAITEILIAPSSGTLSGTVYLYGRK